MNQGRGMDEITITAPAFTLSAAPHWVASDKGFFREEGLNVTIEYVLGHTSRWLLDMFPGRILFEQSHQKSCLLRRIISKGFTQTQ